MSGGLSRELRAIARDVLAIGRGRGDNPEAILLAKHEAAETLLNLADRMETKPPPEAERLAPVATRREPRKTDRPGRTIEEDGDSMPSLSAQCGRASSPKNCATDLLAPVASLAGAKR